MSTVISYCLENYFSNVLYRYVQEGTNLITQFLPFPNKHSGCLAFGWGGGGGGGGGEAQVANKWDPGGSCTTPGGVKGQSTGKDP